MKMNPFKLLANFNVEFWYKMFVLLGLAMMFLGLLMPVQTISNGSLMTMGLGVFLLGTGEWINHPFVTEIDPYLRFKAFGHPRRNSIGGVLLAVTGGLILVAGLIAAVYSAFS